MGRNGYLERQKRRTDAYRQAEKETYIQFMTDLFSLTLNDPDIMGKDVLGRKRLKKVLRGVSANYDTWHGALEKGPEAEYMQVRFDERLQKIYGPDFVRMGIRYGWLKETI